MSNASSANSAAASPAHAVDAPPLLPANAALFVDLDGTLVPIAATPQAVQVPPWVVPLLERLQRRLAGALAVVSGRPLVGVDALLRPLRLPGAGVHGMERRLTDGRMRIHHAQVPESARQAAQALVREHPELLLEPKPGSLALHYRAEPALGPQCLSRLRAALDNAPDWEVLEGHCVAEVKPRSVSKGAVVTAFMAQPPFAGRVPVFVGDDNTDEDGIAAAQAAGGFGVRIGPGATQARHRLADSAAVGRWLEASFDAA